MVTPVYSIIWKMGKIKEIIVFLWLFKAEKSERKVTDDKMY